VGVLAAGEPWRSSPGLAGCSTSPRGAGSSPSTFSWAIPTEQGARGPRESTLRSWSAAPAWVSWSALLQSRGVDAIAYDLLPPGGRKPGTHTTRAGRRPWTEVRQGSRGRGGAPPPVKRALFLCWPPYDDDAASYAALRAYRATYAIHVGERDEGVTGSVRFHRRSCA